MSDKVNEKIEIKADKLYVRKSNTFMGELLHYRMNSCFATVAEGKHKNGKKWATIYDIQSGERGKGHATKLLLALKDFYKDWDFGGTVALNDTMKHLYEKTGIKEYADEPK